MLTNTVHSLSYIMLCLIGTHFGLIVMGTAPCISNSTNEYTSSISTTLLTVNDIILCKGSGNKKNCLQYLSYLNTINYVMNILPQLIPVISHAVIVFDSCLKRNNHPSVQTL